MWTVFINGESFDRVLKKQPYGYLAKLGDTSICQCFRRGKGWSVVVLGLGVDYHVVNPVHGLRTIDDCFEYALYAKGIYKKED